MRAVDTSIAVAAFGAWHRLHDAARAVMDEGVAAPAHVLLETYAVLTGFPPPHRAAPDVVATWLADRFTEVLAPPAGVEHHALVALLAGHGRSGGAIYDALVAMTAQAAGATLITADERAEAIYDLVGVEVRRLIS